MKVHCPQCRGTFRVEGEETGNDFACPFCKAPFSFRDKQTIVLTSAPETQVRVEREDPTSETGEELPPFPERQTVTRPSAVKNPAAGSPPPGARPVGAADHAAPSRKSVPPLPPDFTNLKVGDRLNGYLLEEVIGWGGMSVVFRAQQMSLNRMVAVKVLRKDLGDDAEFSRRFLKEAQALADLSHPNIISVFDQGVHEGNHYLVMEYIDGVSLRDVLNEKALSASEALKLVPELCTALEYAHSRGIIHRDIKPENILLDRNGTPRIADFGLVRMLGPDQVEASRITKTQTVMGTLDYMAPEQREGRGDIDHRADIYSLGVVLYEMLTGELPLARFPLPSERVEVDVRLDQVVLKVLAKDRDRRYQRASLVATDLKQIQSSPSGPLSSTGVEGLAPWQRVLTMAGSPLFFFFTLIYCAVVIGSQGDDEPICLFTGAAIPFYATQLILHGLLPRLVIPRHIFIARHPLLAALALLMFVGIVTGSGAVDEDTGIFFIGCAISSGICVAAARRKIFRERGEPAFLGAVPGGFARRFIHPEPAPRPHPPRRVELKRVAPNAEAGAPFGQRPNIAAASPAATDPSQLTPSLGHVDPATKRDRESHESSTRPRLSWLVLFGFLLSVVTFVYATVLVVFFTVFDWKLLLLDLPIDYREVENFFRGIWTEPLAIIKLPVTVVSIVVFLPLLVPAVVSLFGFLRLQAPNKRGGPLLAISVLLLIVQVFMITGAQHAVHRGAQEYLHTVDQSRYESDSDVVRAVHAAVEAEDPLLRFATFHRAVVLSGGDPPPLEARESLAQLALRRNLTLQERKVTLALLVFLYPEGLCNADAESPVWLEEFQHRARHEPWHVRDGYLEVLSRCAREELTSLFWEVITQQSRLSWHQRSMARDWWTRAAPPESLEWALERLPWELETDAGARNSYLKECFVKHPDLRVRERAEKIYRSLKL